MLRFMSKHTSYFSVDENEEDESTPLLRRKEEENNPPAPNCRLECEEGNENVMLEALEGAQNNLNLTEFYFNHCVLSGPVKNLIAQLFQNHNVLEIGFEDCGLNSFDLPWLKYILSKASVVQSISLIEDLTKNEFFEIFNELPGRYLKKIGLCSHHIQALAPMAHSFPQLQELEIVNKKFMRYAQMEALWDMIESKKIQSLTMASFWFDDSQTYQFFLKKLRKNDSLNTLYLGDYYALENNLLAILISENTSLTEIFINDDPVPKIELFLSRNKIIQNAIYFNLETIPEDHDIEALDDFNLRKEKIIVALQSVSHKNYVSICEDRIQDLIQLLTSNSPVSAKMVVLLGF